MPIVHNPKHMAKRLRSALAARDISLSHSLALEIVAAQLGFADWNTAAALLKPTTLKIPKGWTLSGANPTDYDVGVDPENPDQGATIRARDVQARQGGFATLMQSIAAKPYLGSRVQLSAKLRSHDVVGATTIWLRIDGAGQGGLRFDNMERRTQDGTLQGKTDWQERRIVLDVPPEAESIHYGFYLRGSGQCWARDIDLQKVGETIAVTSGSGPYLDAPNNLGMSVT